MVAEQKKSYLETRLGKPLKLARKGYYSKPGILLDLNDEFLTLLSEEDGVTYHRMQHLKSLSHNTREDKDEPFELDDDFDFEKAVTFNELLLKLKDLWVNINNHTSENVEGILIKADDEWVTLISKEEVVQLAIFHIRNISSGNKPQITGDQDIKENKLEKKDKKSRK